MEIKRITLSSLEKILDGIVRDEHDVVVKFYGDECYLCHGLKPVYEEIAETYKDIKFYVFNMADGGEYVENKYGFEGTPSICFVKTGPKRSEVKFLKEPSKPDRQTWYYKDDIKKFIERYK